MNRIAHLPTPATACINPHHPHSRHHPLLWLFGWSLTFVCLWGMAWTVWATDKQPGLDAVLLMDSSGSMHKNDPKKLRVPAAKLFMSLLGKEDRVGLVSFSDAGYPVLHLTHLDGDMQDKALAATDRVSSKGIYTNLYAALLKGREMLEKEGDPDREKIMILMSDGRMDVGDDFEDHKLSKQVAGEVIDQLKADKIKVYTIAFTEASDMELLGKVADDTGALSRLARTDRDLHEVFSTIFESAKAPDMLPMEGGEFVVDSSIEEVTIVASKERSDVRIYLESPSGKQVSSDDAGDSLKWFVSDYFDMITVRNPEQGRWKLLFSAGNNRAYIVTNLSMGTNLKGGEVDTGTQTDIESWLEKDGKLLNTEAMLTNTRFFIEITEPDGAVSDAFPMLDQGDFGDRQAADGIYSNMLTFSKPGEHKLKVIARSETFERSKAAYFHVLEPAEPMDAPEPAPEPVTEPEPEAEPVEPAPPVEPEIPVLAEEIITETPEEEGTSLGVMLGVFLGVNLMLALIGGGTWWFLARRKKKAAAAAQADELEDEDLE